MSSHPIQRALYPLLYPFGKAYAQIMQHRRTAYRNGNKAQFAPVVPCVSVGNIGWGGSGKTPIVDWLITWAETQRMAPAVLTRGYKASPPHTPYLVTESSSASEAGDEPCMLAKAHPDAAVIVDPVRMRSGNWAQEELTPDLFILDDGFQHLAVQRDIDLVLLKPADLDEEWNRVIPSGSWREDASTLSCADAFLIKVPDGSSTGTCNTDHWRNRLNPKVTQRLGGLNTPVFPFAIKPHRLIPITDPQHSFDTTRPYVLMSGVGDPDQVQDTMTRFLGRAPEHHAIFSDHHAYTLKDVVEVTRKNVPLVCTPKDAVKLPVNELINAGVECWTMELTVEFGQSWFCQTRFPQWWETIWRALVISAESKTTL